MHFPHFVKRGLLQFCQFLIAKVQAWTKPCSPLLGAASDLTRSKQELILENLLLRQQSRVVDQQVKRPKLTWGDRALLVVLASQLKTWQSYGGRLAHPFRPEAHIHPHFVKAISISSKIIH